MDDTAAIPAQRNRPARVTLKDDEVLDIVVRVQNNDTEAFGDLYRAYSEIVSRYIYNRVDDHELAEDLTSEVFLRALRAIPGFTWQGGQSVHGWLITIARNLVADHLMSAPYTRQTLTAKIHDLEREALDTDDLVAAVAREQLPGGEPGDLEHAESGGIDLDFVQDCDHGDLAAQLGIATGGRRVRDRRDTDLLVDRAVTMADPSAEDVAVSEQFISELESAVLRLGPRQQECLILRSFHGQSVAHTAWIMGVSEGAVKMLQLRAVRSLAGILQARA